ncbi:unnamed protein product [Fusarium equiseti]|uniref:Uncharacterized protein n=1 Tax=Fusarium equiseti TaxID=61235 RepID=A0A8J2NLQ2_FUSEQ|nr:unnamed protein product [Fusarium equiseti]
MMNEIGNIKNTINPYIVLRMFYHNPHHNTFSLGEACFKFALKRFTTLGSPVQNVGVNAGQKIVKQIYAHTQYDANATDPSKRQDFFSSDRPPYLNCRDRRDTARPNEQPCGLGRVNGKSTREAPLQPEQAVLDHGHAKHRLVDEGCWGFWNDKILNPKTPALYGTLDEVNEAIAMLKDPDLVQTNSELERERKKKARASPLWSTSRCTNLSIKIPMIPVMTRALELTWSCSALLSDYSDSRASTPLPSDRIMTRTRNQGSRCFEQPKLWQRSVHRQCEYHGNWRQHAWLLSKRHVLELA